MAHRADSWRSATRRANSSRATLAGVASSCSSSERRVVTKVSPGGLGLRCLEVRLDGSAGQCDINTGTVIDASRPRVAPPSTRSVQRAWP